MMSTLQELLPGDVVAKGTGRQRRFIQVVQVDGERVLGNWIKKDGTTREVNAATSANLSEVTLDDAMTEKFGRRSTSSEQRGSSDESFSHLLDSPEGNQIIMTEKKSSKKTPPQKAKTKPKKATAVAAPPKPKAEKPKAEKPKAEKPKAEKPKKEFLSKTAIRKRLREEKPKYGLGVAHEAHLGDIKSPLAHESKIKPGEKKDVNFFNSPRTGGKLVKTVPIQF